ncbi:haloacid dehalogenase-like hydrolase [Selenomonas ruminantium]|uniref:haloacid dehalogenase-like hydrolase n=1 Tax=Selenomonas ruminantium TaxID=971 RepID=UPI00047C5788|nr:haloacid dehalogenase-like hydrolase [Selenomonas ruminantium]
MSRIKNDKIAVFDLDDTLYQGNSHFLCLNEFYKTKIFTSIIARCFCKFFPIAYLRFANYLYDKIPYEYRSTFKLPYRNEVIKLFKKKQKTGYQMLILSNAPIELLKTAANELHVDYLKAGIGEKSRCLHAEFEYQELFVCTDNMTDIDLLNIANEAVITCRPSKRGFFTKRVKCKNYKFIEDVCDNEV